MGAGVKHVRRQALWRVAVASVLAGLASMPAAATAGPDALTGPSQQHPPEHEDDANAATTGALVGVETSLTTGDASGAAEALDRLEANVEQQMAQLDAAEAAVADAVSKLADRDAAIAETQRRIDELTAQMDEVTIDAFISPPSIDTLDVLTAGNMDEMSVRQALLELQSDAVAADLAELGQLRADAEVQQVAQEEGLADAEAARAEAEAALANLEAAISQQTRFVDALRDRLEVDPATLEALKASDPARAAELERLQAELGPRLEAAKAAAAYEAALEAIAAEERRQAELGIWKCPVQGPVSFTNSWGAARSGGRSHKGADMLAARGIPTVAPVSGRVEHRSNSLGGLSWWVYGDDGNTYYGAHLSAYENVGVGRVERGTVIGYVGDSGNAAGTNHLHFEFHPGGGSAVNPYQRLGEVC